MGKKSLDKTVPSICLKMAKELKEVCVEWMECMCNDLIKDNDVMPLFCVTYLQFYINYIVMLIVYAELTYYTL